MARFFFCGLLIYAALFLIVQEGQIQRFITSFMPIWLVAFLNGAFLHFFFWFFYLHFIQIMDRTPTARIMIEIEASPQKKLSLDELKKLYSFDRKVSGELEDLVLFRRLEKEANLYKITPKGRIHLKIFKSIRDYLRLARS